MNWYHRLMQPDMPAPRVPRASHHALLAATLLLGGWATLGGCGAEEEHNDDASKPICCNGRGVELGCARGQAPPVAHCPSGQQCVGVVTSPGPCYAYRNGYCEAIPTSCPEAHPEDAVVAYCDEEAAHAGVALPPDRVFASECHAKQAGYVWHLRPASEVTPEEDNDVLPERICCRGTTGEHFCADGQTPVAACPTGQQCVDTVFPYCDANQHGFCEPIPTDCPEALPEDAVVADCAERAVEAGLALPPDNIYPSACHAKQAGYRWILTPVP